MSKKDTIAGHPVIASFVIPLRADLESGRIVIVDRGETDPQKLFSAPPARYVVANHCQNQSDWLDGIYCDDLGKALGHFVNRIGNYAGVHISIPLGR